MEEDRSRGMYCKTASGYEKLYAMAIRASFVVPLIFSIMMAAVWPGTSNSVEVKAEVTLRASRHEGFSRIVFEAQNEPFIKSTVVTNLPNQIKVQFPSSVNLKVQTKPELETALKDNLYTIRVNTPFRIKISQLSSPPRLSIDITPQAAEEVAKTSVKEIAAALSPNVRVVLDPGHGGYDLGIPAGELREKDVSLSVARLMETTLIKKARTVSLTRKADQYLSITDRALFANQKSADIFISVHLSPSANFVIYTSPAEVTVPDPVDEAYGMMTRQRRYADKSKALSESLGKAITEEFKKDVVFRKMELPLLSSVSAAAVMVEIPASIVSDQVVKSKISDALLKGIAAYASQ